MSKTPAIEVTDLVKRYPESGALAVNGLNLTINKGEIFGLLGPNGAGKTTTISMLYSLLKPTSGEIKIFGYNLSTKSHIIRKMIGVVPQDIALYDNLTAFENLRFFGNMYNISGNDLNERINSLLEIFGLSQKANALINSFSGGMKRRINLIAGILHSPDLLFLDEPTVGIDVQSRNVIIEFLSELNTKGTTIIYTSHHMEEAEKFCSRVAIIDQGVIIEKGKPELLIQNHNNCQNLEDIFLEKTGRSLRD